MSASEPSLIEARRHQMFPTLAPAEIERLRRFGEVRSYRAGEHLARTGEVAPGLSVILSGRVTILQRDALAARPPIVIHGPGSFMGELAQLSGRPALVDAQARRARSRRWSFRRAGCATSWWQEAELGERIMRALILRRVGLLETRRRADR